MTSLSRPNQSLAMLGPGSNQVTNSARPAHLLAGFRRGTILFLSVCLLFVASANCDKIGNTNGK